MKIVPYYDIDIDEIAMRLGSGEVLVMPTETSYGLIADATNKKSVEKIFAIKRRNITKPLPIIFSSYNQVIEYCQVPDLLSELAQKYWPGPLSIIVQPIDGRLKANLSGDYGETVAVRVTSDSVLQEVMKIFKKPLIATSANISGENTSYDCTILTKSFDHNTDQPDLVIDKGILPIVKPSTLIAVENKEIKILRQGPIEVG